MITEILQGLGSFEIQLAEHTPQDLLDQLDWFGHVAVAAGRVDVEAAGQGMLTGARYVGTLRGRTADGRGLAGSGMAYWLGDEDEKARTVLATEVSLTNATLAAAVAAVLPVTVTTGTVYAQPDPLARYTGKHRFQTPRKALQTICDAFGVEFRVNGDGSVDVGPRASLYRTLPGSVVPKPLLVRRGAGADIDTVALAGQVEIESGVWDFSSDIILLGQTTDQATFATGEAHAPGVTPYKDLLGNEYRVVRMISESGETVGSVAARAQLQLNRFNRITRALSLRADDYESEGTFRPGDDVYVYDPETGIYNPANEVDHNGRLLHPDVVRCSGMAWPVARGMTVGFRRSSGAWLDLTDYVTWETGGGDVTIGDLPASLTRPTDSPISLRVDSSRGVDTTIPNPPTGLTLSSYSVVNPRGGNSAVITASWTAPTTNTDGSVPVDLAYYNVRWRATGRPDWQQTTATSATTVDLPAVIDLDYDVQVQAADKANNLSAFTATSTIHTSVDTTAPPTPADLTVTSWRGQARIISPGTAAGGGLLPSDTNRIDVEVATSTGGPWTVISSLSPNVQQVAYYDVPVGSTRYFRARAYDHTGNVSAATSTASLTGAQIPDGEIASISAGKIDAGTVTSDIVIAGRFATALTGARREMNAVGFQAWNASNNLTISLDGVNNLLTGQYKTALSGRRIEMGAAGTAGQIYFISPDDVTMRLQAFTATVGDPGTEAIRMGMLPTNGSIWPGWGSIQVENPGEYWAWLPEYSVVVGGNGAEAVGDKAFYVMWATTRGTASANPARASRIYVGVTQNSHFYPVGGSFGVWERDGDGQSDTTYNRFQITDTDFWFRWSRTDQGRALFQAAQDGTRAARVQLITPNDFGVTYSHRSNTDGSQSRAEIRDALNSGFQDVWGGAYTNASSERFKNAITTAVLSARAKLRDRRIVTFQRKGGTGLTRDGQTLQAPDGAVELGVIAEEMPEDVVTRDETGAVFGVNSSAMDALLLRYAQELDDRVDAVEALVTKLGGRLP